MSSFALHRGTCSWSRVCPLGQTAAWPSCAVKHRGLHPQWQLHSQLRVLAAFLRDGYCSIFMERSCPCAGSEVSIIGVQTAVRDRMVLPGVSVCLSAPAPSPAAPAVVISARYLLMPVVSREGTCWVGHDACVLLGHMSCGAVQGQSAHNQHRSSITSAQDLV